MPLPNHLRLPATRRFQATIASVVDRATPALQRAFDSLDDYDEASIAALTAKVTSNLTAVKATAVRSALGYYTVLAGVRPPTIAPGEVPTTANIRAPFISVWQALASGHSFEDARLAGRARIEAVAMDFAVSSARQTGDLFVAKAGLRVSGWDRIPEAGACDWCEQVAADTYPSAEAADFGHDRCQCTAAPAF